MRFYVYGENIDSGRTFFVRDYETKKEAVEKIRTLLIMDADGCQKNEFYYYIKERNM